MRSKVALKRFKLDWQLAVKQSLADGSIRREVILRHHKEHAEFWSVINRINKQRAKKTPIQFSNTPATRFKIYSAYITLSENAKKFCRRSLAERNNTGGATGDVGSATGAATSAVGDTSDGQNTGDATGDVGSGTGSTGAITSAVGDTSDEQNTGDVGSGTGSTGAATSAVGDTGQNTGDATGDVGYATGSTDATTSAVGDTSEGKEKPQAPHAAQVQEIGSMKTETLKYQQPQQQQQTQHYYVQHQQQLHHINNNNNLYYQQQNEAQIYHQQQPQRPQQVPPQQLLEQQQFNINPYGQQRYQESHQQQQLHQQYAKDGDDETEEDQGEDEENQETEEDDEQQYNNHQQQQLHHQYNQQSTTNNHNNYAVDPVGDLEGQIEASTIRFSMQGSKLDFPGADGEAHDNYKIIQTPLPKIANTRQLNLADGIQFNMDKEIGRGSYGTVYKATDVVTAAVVALKFEKPANTWEIYICDQILKRVQAPNILPGLMDISTAIINED